MARVRSSPLSAALASQLHARDLAQEDGGLVRYAERLAKKRERAAVPMRHLSPVADVFERAHRAALGQGPPVFAVVHAPVRHGKTTLVQAAMLRSSIITAWSVNHQSHIRVPPTPRIGSLPSFSARGNCRPEFSRAVVLPDPGGPMNRYQGN